MFERYTEKARRSIFFARYEASQFGSPYIETEHLLMGLLREDKALTNRFLRTSSSVEDIRQQIQSATTVREKVSTSVDLPLSNENKRVLAYAAEEAERLSHKHIGTEHLLLGLLREEKSFAAQLLHGHNVRLSAVREELAQAIHESEAAERGTVHATTEGGQLSDFSVYLTRLAREGRLLPCIGRGKEIEQVVHILGRSTKNNAVLVGQQGAGKRTIAEGLVQRVTDHKGPAFLEERLFAALDLAMFVTAAQHSSRPKEFLQAAVDELTRWGANTIFVFDELHALLAAGPGGGANEVTLLLKALLMQGKARCIAAATPEEYRAAHKKARWLESCFLAVEVAPASEAETLTMLHGIRARFEKFHSVQYSDAALEAAVAASVRYVKNRCLPDKAIDLIDDAGAYVKMKADANAPPELVEARKRIRFVVRRTEEAIANHEFEKARFYSDEERKQRALLGDLEKANVLNPWVVTPDHIAEALARWTGVPVAAIQDAAEPIEDKEPGRPGLRPKKRAKKK